MAKIWLWMILIDESHKKQKGNYDHIARVAFRWAAIKKTWEERVRVVVRAGMERVGGKTGARRGLREIKGQGSVRGRTGTRRE